MNKFVDHIHSMASDPRRIGRIRNRLEQIYGEVRRATTLKEAISNGQSVNSVSMRLRHLHDELGCHVNDLCAGAIYRSSGVINAEAGNLLTTNVVRQEHTIPVHVVAGILFNRFRDKPLESMTGFLLQNTIVTAVVRNAPVFALGAEVNSYVVEDSRSCLGLRRSYDGSVKRAWRNHHPEYDHHSEPGLLSSLPFRRYAGTGIRIFSAIDGQEVDLNCFSLADHHRHISGLALYDAGTYFDASQAAA